jgi:hypothetical protein
VRLVLAAAVSLVATACLDQNRPGFAVVNGTGDHLEVVIEVEDRQTVLDDDLEPGLTLYSNEFVNGGQCIDATLTAMDPSGRTVATFPGPVCDGTRWEVTAQP